MANRPSTPGFVRPIEIVPAERPVFLVNGLHKSGTTWVQQILNAHPKAACRTEDMFVKISEGLKEVFHRYNQIIAEEDRRRAKQGIDGFDLDDVLACYYFMIRRALAKAPAEAEWSGIKDNLLNADAFLTYVPRSRVIHVIRDPRDLAVSSWASNIRLDPDRKAPLTDKTPPLDPDFAARVFAAWGVFVNEVFDRAAARTDVVHVVRYEDLAADFDAAASGLFGFLGLSSDPDTVAAVRASTDFATLSGGRGSGEEDARSFYRSGVAGGWSERTDRGVFDGLMDQYAGELSRAGYGENK